MDKLDKRSYISWVLCLANFWAHNITPYNLIRCFLCPEQKKWYKKNDTPFIDWYVLLWFIVFIWFLIFLNVKNYFWISIFCILTIFRSFDIIFCYIQMVDLPTTRIISGFRGLFLSLINYGQIILIFAVIYRIENTIINWKEALLISVFTMTNIERRSSAPEWIIAIQSLIGLFFVAIVIALVVNYFGQRRLSNNLSTNKDIAQQ